ncbi:MAG: HDOD domain-containing protein, partial [bacterium]|nr:HDOD domain-containing protein [bacterium]
VAGLLHDIGKMVLYLDNPSNYEKVINEVLTNGRDFIEVENDFFKFTHSDAGFYLAEKWKFSEMLKEVVQHHHKTEAFSSKIKILPVVAFADKLAHIYLEERNENLEEYMELFGINQEQLDNLLVKALQMVESYHSVI